MIMAFLRKLVVVLFLVIFWGGVFFSFSGNSVWATIVNPEKIEKAETQEKLDKYKRVVEKKLKDTSQQKNILTNQLRIFDFKVSKTEENLENITKEYQRNELELKKLSDDLRKKEDEVARLKKDLKKIFILYEESDRTAKLSLLSGDNDFDLVLNQTDYLNKIIEEINQKLAEIKKVKESILSKSEKIEEAKKNILQSKQKLSEEKQILEEQKKIKEDFLVRIKGDERKYLDLLNRIEQQKRNLVSLAGLSETTMDSIAEIKAKAKKPKTGLADTSWYYAQDDPRWAQTTIGFSRTIMKDYGCAVTALAMVFTKHGKKIKPGSLAKKPMFYQDLIVWPNEWKGLHLTSGRTHGNISWKKVDKAIKKKNPVIVFIRSRSGAGHYVVIHHKDKKGKYVVHDPLFGANIYLKTSKKLISSIYKSGVTIDQMLIYE